MGGRPTGPAGQAPDSQIRTIRRHLPFDPILDGRPSIGDQRRNAQTPTFPRLQHAELGLQPWDRYQTLSGLQFYFDTEFQLVHGHIYYTDSTWALSSINHHGLWEAKHRPNLPADGFVSVLSVDIGDWNMPVARVPEPPTTPTPRWQAGERLLAGRDRRRGLASDQDTRSATTCQDRVRTDVSRRRSGTHSTGVSKLTSDAGEQAQIVENRAPYLVPIVSDWQNRPGGDPWNPHHTSSLLPRSRDRKAKDAARDVWAAEHGGYEVHCDRLVFAGHGPGRSPA